MKKSILTIAVALLVALSSGCATVSTLNQPLKRSAPLIMSGTRLDLASLRGIIQQCFGVAAPDYPLLDLPASASLDVLVLGFTVPAALMKVVRRRWHAHQPR